MNGAKVLELFYELARQVTSFVKKEAIASESQSPMNSEAARLTWDFAFSIATLVPTTANISRSGRSPPKAYERSADAISRTTAPFRIAQSGRGRDSIDCDPVVRNATFSDRGVYAHPALTRPEKVKEIPATEIAKARPMIDRAIAVLTYKLAAALSIVSLETRDRYEAILDELERRRGNPIYTF